MNILTVLSVATLKVPGMETPAPPPMVIPSNIATYMDTGLQFEYMIMIITI